MHLWNKFCIFAAEENNIKACNYEVSTDPNQRRRHHLFGLAQLSHPVQHRVCDRRAAQGTNQKGRDGSIPGYTGNARGLQASSPHRLSQSQAEVIMKKGRIQKRPLILTFKTNRT